MMREPIPNLIETLTIDSVRDEWRIADQNFSPAAISKPLIILVDDVLPPGSVELIPVVEYHNGTSG